MAIISMECDVVCATCGDYLSTTFTEADRGREATMNVEPCEKCMDFARDKGRGEAEESYEA